MKRVAQFLIVALIIGGFVSNTPAQDEVNLFDGFWKTKRGSVVRIDGDQGIFVYTPVESWKSYIDKVIIKNIRQKDDKWVADEYIAPDGKGFWAEIEWELDENRIIRRVLFQGETVESEYEKISSFAANPEPDLSANPFRDITGRFGLGARLAYVNYVDEDKHVSGVDVDTEPDDAVMYGVNLTYFAHRYFSLELSVDYVETDVELGALGLSGNGGELEQVPVLLTARMHFSTNPKVNPYIGAGLGYYFNDFDESGQWNALTGNTGIDVDDSIGFHAGAGIEFFVSDDVAICVDCKYVWNRIEAKLDIPGSDDEEFDTNMFVAGVGFKYYF